MKTKSYSLLILLLLIGISAQVLAEKAPFTIEEIIATQSVTQLAMSSDGEVIAYTKRRPRTPYKDKDGAPYSELYVISGKEPVREFIVGEENITKVQFSPDNRFLYYIAKRGKDKFNHVYRIPLDGGESKKIISVKSNVAGFTMDKSGRWLVFWGQEKQPKHVEKLKKKGFAAKVYEESARKSLLWQQDLEDLNAKPKKIDFDKHIIDVSFSPIDRRLLVGWTEDALIDQRYMRQKLSIVNLAGKELARIPTEGKLGKKLWSPDAKNIAFIGAEDIHDPATGRLYYYAIGDKKVTELLPNYPGHVRAIHWYNSAYLAYIGDLNVETELARIKLSNKKKTVIVKPGKMIFSALAFDSKAKRLVVLADSFTHPSEVYDVNIRRGSLTRLSDSNPWFKDKQFAQQEVLNYKARDGLDLQGILIKPLNFQVGRRYPLILFIHGGPEAHLRNGWINRYSEASQVVAAAGYVAFYPNYRGSTGRGVAFSKMGQGDYAGAEFNDIVDAKKHLVDTGLVDTQKVGITGGSYGGYASAWAATALTEHFAASVMFVGISNQLSKFGTTDIPEEMYNVHSRSWPWDKWQWMLERSPIYHAPKAKTPLLILHGEKDTRVHPSQSMELYRYVKQSTKNPVRLVFYPGEGHGNRKVGSQLDYALRFLRWMDTYLKQDGKAMPPYELDHHLRLKKDGEEAEKEDESDK